MEWAKDLNKKGMFDSYDFVSLTPAEEEVNADEGYISFQVLLREKEDEGKETTVSEKSKFIKEGDRWLYASGEVRSEVAGLEDTVLNK